MNSTLGSVVPLAMFQKRNILVNGDNKNDKDNERAFPPIVNYLQPHTVYAASNGPSLVRSIRQLHKYAQSTNTQ